EPQIPGRPHERAPSAPENLHVLTDHSRGTGVPATTDSSHGPASAPPKAVAHPSPVARRVVLPGRIGRLLYQRLVDLPPSPLDHRRRLCGGPHYQYRATGRVRAPGPLP